MGEINGVLWVTVKIALRLNNAPVSPHYITNRQKKRLIIVIQYYIDPEMWFSCTFFWRIRRKTNEHNYDLKLSNPPTESLYFNLNKIKLIKTWFSFLILLFLSWYRWQVIKLLRATGEKNKLRHLIYHKHIHKY